ncbi:DUF979 domain-containing protein [Parasphaerochaeta coccoides]|uniref:Permease n=1 Tax=Parasphaerochaeta coccoides (strain ATCC BAA-1237 / DSM 17374 / SPN1) TaxID=760011 RepID=F4GIH7_PARC1|nr:DUF979 domain-containing protein [Parasphaerochaeta coccoides]AEC01685.1 protein of unknown function DUF979 [Parasphaerochaeta coccoides DSM 17374]
MNNIIAEFFYCVIGVIFILVGLKALNDKTLATRITTALFWFILAFTFIAGPYLPHWVTGACVLIIAVLTAFKRVTQSKSDVPSEETTRSNANKLGYTVFIPALCLALVAVLAATFLPFGANNAIGISAAVALLVVFLITKAPAKSAVTDGSRLMDNVGPVGILPQLLAALGALFTAAGVGTVIANGVSAIIPEGMRIIAVAVYCIGMALFTIIMGNGFAAFSVITVGIGIPFLIMQGANPVVVGALGLTAGYCGTLLTPMAANFNIMPAALLETKNKYVIIKAQAPVAITMLFVHIVLMYILAF